MLKKFVKENWHWLSAGTVLSMALTRHMETVRGCSEIGGELLILPLFGIAAMLCRQIQKDGLFKILFDGKNEGDGDEDDERG